MTPFRELADTVLNAAELRSRTHAVVIGERSRAKPNNPSEGRELVLPRTRVRLWLSTQIVTRDASLKDADYLPVDIAVPVRISEYVAGRDAALEVALQEVSRR